MDRIKIQEFGYMALCSEDMWVRSYGRLYFSFPVYLRSRMVADNQPRVKGIHRPQAVP